VKIGYDRLSRKRSLACYARPFGHSAVAGTGRRLQDFDPGKFWLGRAEDRTAIRPTAPPRETRQSFFRYSAPQPLAGLT
jgi:hypothetical protein